MIQILFHLSLYKLYVKKESDSYFQNFAFLEYSFKSDAIYDINFTAFTKQRMIFGLATKEEITNIDKRKHIRQLCEGNQKLSEIQFNVTNITEGYGKIKAKSILTPYIFTCNLSFYFLAYFDYSNGSNHMDSRCQIMTIVSLLYFIIVFLITLPCFEFYCYKYYKKNEEIIKKSSFYTFLTLFAFSMQDLLQFLFFKLHKNQEYFDVRYETDENLYLIPHIFKHDNLTMNAKFFDAVIELALLMSAIKNLFLYEKKMSNSENVRQNLKKYLTILLWIYGFTIPLLMCINQTKVVRILIYIFYLIGFSAYFLFPPLLSRVKATYSILLIGNFVTVPFCFDIFYSKHDIMSVHYLAFVMSIVSLLVQTATVPLLLMYLHKLQQLDGISVEDLNKMLVKPSSYVVFNDYNSNQMNQPIINSDNNLYNRNVPIYINDGSDMSSISSNRFLV